MATDSSLSVAARYSYPGSTRSEFTPRRAAAPCLKRARGLAWVSFSCCACSGSDAADQFAVLCLRNRWFADSPLEGDGFEPSVPRSGQRQAARNQIFRETTGAKHTNKAADRLVRRAPNPPSRNLPPSPFLYRHRRARRTVQLTFVSSIHNPKIMLRMLGKGSLPRLDHH